MLKSTRHALIGALALGCLAAPSIAQEVEETARLIVGAFRSHETREEFDLSVGVNPSGTPIRDHKRIFVRETVNVPSHYGRLFEITQTERASILWYRDEQDVVRNVAIDATDEYLYRVEASPSGRLEIDRY